MRPVAINGTGLAPEAWQSSRERSLHVLETAAPAILALAIATDVPGRYIDSPERAAITPVADAPPPEAHVGARVLKWESVARLTIGKPPRAARVQVV